MQMTKQELLTRLATECKTWDAAAKQRATWVSEYPATLAITKQDWLAERERLLNKPSWDDAPNGANLLGLEVAVTPWECHGQWKWIFKNPVLIKSGGWGFSTHAGWAIAIPAGYDWRDSLEVRPV